MTAHESLHRQYRSTSCTGARYAVPPQRFNELLTIAASAVPQPRSPLHGYRRGRKYRATSRGKRASFVKPSGTLPGVAPKSTRALHLGTSEPTGRPADTSCPLTLMDAMAEDDSAGGEHTKKLLDSMKRHSEQSEAQVRSDWLDAAQATLPRNPSTLVIRPMHGLVRPDDYLARLTELDHAVEEPPWRC